MAPINVLDPEAPRFKNSGPIAPNRIFICEGSNTEVWYLDQLFKDLESRGIAQRVNFVVAARTGKELGWSGLSKLSEIATKVQNGIPAKEFGEELLALARAFDDRRDKIVLVFDTDRFADNADWEGFHDFLKKEWSYGRLLVPLRPNFELFLLLHAEDPRALIAQNRAALLECQKSGESGKRFSEELVEKELRFDPKKDESAVRALAARFGQALIAEKDMNRVPDKAEYKLTSSIAYIIQAFIERLNR